MNSETSETRPTLPTLPGMSDYDFDYCVCGVGGLMGKQHRWDCPAHCICNRETQTVCAYHRGMSEKRPTPSVMTEVHEAEGRLAATRVRENVGSRLVKRPRRTV